MKLRALMQIVFSIVVVMSCSTEKKNEIPLSHYDGYGHFNSSFGGVSTYSDDENNP